MRLIIRPITLVLAGIIGMAIALVPLSTSVLPGIGSGPAAPTTPPPPDVITYVQGAGAGGTTVTFTPAGNSGEATTQTVTPSGSCGTPTVNGAPILNMSAQLYPPEVEYSGTPSPSIVGSAKGQTGVCDIGAAYTVDNDPEGGAEGLDFSIGTNSVLGANRVFSEAQLQIVRKVRQFNGPRNGGVSNISYASVPVQLVEWLAGTQVATQTCTINGGAGTQITADTALNSVCTGTPAGAFDTLEVQVPQAYSSVSVFGTSTFTLADTICGGQSISSTGPVSATLSLPSDTGCKSFTDFSSSYSGIPGQPQTVTFDAFSAGSIPFTVVIPWNQQPDCQPSDDPSNPLPVCAPTQLSFDGTTFTDQTYCAQATLQDPLCTQSKQYNYIVGTDGTVYTQITETWVGLLDWVTRH